METIALDDIFAHVLEPIFVMKIDVEGFEARVFNGFRDTIATHPPMFILMEFSPRLKSASQCSARQLWRMFEATGYSFHTPAEAASGHYAGPVTFDKAFIIHDVVLVHQTAPGFTISGVQPRVGTGGSVKT